MSDTGASADSDAPVPHGTSLTPGPRHPFHGLPRARENPSRQS